MIKQFIQFFLIVFFGILVGRSLSYVSSMPTSTEEMSKYQEFLNSSDSFIGDEIDVLNELEKKAMSSINSPIIDKQSLFLTIIFIPLCILAFTIVWYFIGLNAQYDGYLKYIKITVAIVILLYFGYFYQPYINIIGYVLGSFGFLKNETGVRMNLLDKADNFNKR